MISTGKKSGNLRLQSSFSRVATASVNLPQLIPRQAERFRTIARIGQVSRHQLQLKQKIGRRCRTGEQKGIFSDAKTDTGVSSRQNPAKIVRTMFTEPASVKSETRKQRNAFHFLRFRQLTRPQTNLRLNRIRLKIGLFQIQTNTIFTTNLIKIDRK